jgi:phage gpG-like protein
MAGNLPLANLPGELRRVAGLLRSPSTLTPVLKSAGLMMLADVKRNFNESHDPDGRPWAPLAHPRPSGGAKPLQDRGLLAASFSSKVTGAGVVVGSNRVGVNLHQMGGTISPKRAKFLAIPLTRAAQRRGRPRRFSGLLHAVMGARGGVLLDEHDVAQFALTKGPIRIPARPMVGFGARLLGRLDQLFIDFLRKLIGAP